MSASDWKVANDPETGQEYYYNKKTRETTWDKPKELQEQAGGDVGGGDGAPDGAPAAAAWKPPTILDFPSSSSEEPSVGTEETSTKSVGNCASCGEMIKGPSFTANNKNFHPKCFVCVTGEHTLAPSYQFHVYQNKIYCPEHYLKAFEKKCAGNCGKGILEDFIQVGNDYYHPGCWKCRDCKKALSTDDHGVFRNEFYCKVCFDKWINQDEDLKAKAAHDKLQERLAAMKMKKTQPAAAAPKRILKEGETIPFEELKAAKDLPVNLDTNRKEIYLSDRDFATYLKMGRGDFEKLPKWKKDKIKKELGIF